MTMPQDSLQTATASVPPGRWAVGVSGGADSVALLSLLRNRPDLSLTVVHLDHQTRQGESAKDAAFVAQLAANWQLECVLSRRSDLKSQSAEWPRNLSARYRAMRMFLFRRVVQERNLEGVILAHHFDDQAETVLQRLLRGSDFPALAGIRQRTVITGMTVLHPLLSVRRQTLRDYLQGLGQEWCEDKSNATPSYQRNRVRRALLGRDALADSLVKLSLAAAALADWAQEAAPYLPPTFPTVSLAGCGPLLSHTAARRWLIERGCPAEEVSAAVVDRLLAMAQDAATPPRQDFPNRLRAHRRHGRIWAG